ncbi:protease pro-enzyme activation domain-containing protein [Caballeronia sp. M1242]|uniref:S53 family peptidase n=1 Tax=Caballeronia sp. M1242 TaxID=2814653 RepID=UPI0019D218A5|nr:S53 family peptidase [Caballeronia sp. M1242]QSN63577.1 S8/S53 family peptidase [Caballeronia sp. M1242]
MAKQPVSGSDKTHPEGAKCVGACDLGEQIEVIVMLRRKDEAGFRQMMARIDSGDAPAQSVTRDEFDKRFGASQDDVEKIKKFAAENGLTVVRAERSTRSVVLKGSIEQFQKAFDVKLERFQHHNIGEYRGRSGPVNVPDDIHDAVTAVLGLDSRPQARPHFRFRPPFKPARGVTPASFSPVDLAALYDFPEGDGAGQCIAIIELGGGYRDTDLSAYFSKLGVKSPKVVSVSVDNAKNAPTGNPNGPDGEVTLDIEIAGAIAPGARIAVYFAPNSDAGFVDAVNRAIHDNTNKPSVVSISWGGPEANWTSQSINAFNDVLQSAAALGVTVCAAAGDSGSSDGVGDGSNHVDFPASSPYVLGCGGTSLAASAQSITHEVVWNDGDQGGSGGGGVSAVFALPVWQKGLSVAHTGGKHTPLSKRGVPDVAGDASPQTGYEVVIDGEETVVGGTSAVAPLWAALIARINAINGAPCGFVNPKLYKAKTAFRDITQGNNGSFAASAGWDACTGLGSPNGGKIAAALTPASGQTRQSSKS